MTDLKECFVTIPNHPDPGVQFRDVSPLLADPAALEYAINKLCGLFDTRKYDKIVAIEARGFLFGGAMAYKTARGCVMARKKGKLPPETWTGEPFLSEYDEPDAEPRVMEIRQGVIKPGERILLVDDVIATGGTIMATAKLIEDPYRVNATVVGVAALAELSYLPGREVISKHYPVKSVVVFD